VCHRGQAIQYVHNRRRHADRIQSEYQVRPRGTSGPCAKNHRVRYSYEQWILTQLTSNPRTKLKVWNDKVEAVNSNTADIVILAGVSCVGGTLESGPPTRIGSGYPRWLPPSDLWIYQERPEAASETCTSLCIQYSTPVYSKVKMRFRPNMTLVLGHIISVLTLGQKNMSSSVTGWPSVRVDKPELS
jgi:hypothetical protein